MACGTPNRTVAEALLREIQADVALERQAHQNARNGRTIVPWKRLQKRSDGALARLMNCRCNRRFDGVAFLAPNRCGKGNRAQPMQRFDRDSAQALLIERLEADLCSAFVARQR